MRTWSSTVIHAAARVTRTLGLRPYRRLCCCARFSDHRCTGSAPVRRDQRQKMASRPTRNWPRFVARRWRDKVTMRLALLSATTVLLAGTYLNLAATKRTTSTWPTRDGNRERVAITARGTVGRLGDEGARYTAVRTG